MDADGRLQFRIRNGFDTSMTIGDQPMVNDLSYRPWEVSVAGIAALRKELSSNPEQIAPAPPIIKVQLVDSKVQLVEKPKPRAKAQTPSQPTEKQIQAWMMIVAPVPKPGSTYEKLRRYAVKKYRERWPDKNPADVMKAAENDPEYEKEVGVIRYGISTWRRAFGRKD